MTISGLTLTGGTGGIEAPGGAVLADSASTLVYLSANAHCPLGRITMTLEDKLCQPVGVAGAKATR